MPIRERAVGRDGRGQKHPLGKDQHGVDRFAELSAAVQAKVAFQPQKEGQGRLDHLAMWSSCVRLRHWTRLLDMNGLDFMVYSMLSTTLCRPASLTGGFLITTLPPLTHRPQEARKG